MYVECALALGVTQLIPAIFHCPTVVSIVSSMLVQTWKNQHPLFVQGWTLRWTGASTTQSLAANFQKGSHEVCQMQSPWLHTRQYMSYNGWVWFACYNTLWLEKVRVFNSVDAGGLQDHSRYDSCNWKGDIPFGSGHYCSVPNEVFRGWHSSTLQSLILQRKLLGTSHFPRFDLCKHVIRVLTLPVRFAPEPTCWCLFSIGLSHHPKTACMLGVLYLSMAKSECL